MIGRTVAVLGATGSIGQATIDVVEQLGPPWNIQAISAHCRIAELHAIAARHSPRRAIISGSSGENDFFQENSSSGKQHDRTAADRRLAWPAGCELLSGPDGLLAAATAEEVDVVVAAIVGRAGVESTLAALQAGKRVALANKETLVCAGSVVETLLYGNADKDRAANKTGPTAWRPLAGPRLLPVDSEHSAIFQCLETARDTQRSCERLILTASGGPFRTWTYNQMREATVAQALKHPTWEMGKKISIDSATMMNKALEIVEARWLFGMPAESLEVVVHPQSIVHSLVEFIDGSILAQLSPPDMRLPIQYALTYPERLPCPAARLDRTKSWELTLQPVDRELFPAISLGFEVAKAGGTAGSVVNAANEAAVDLFLEERIRFTDIVPACRTVLENHTFEARPSLERLLELDQWARAEVRRWSSRKS
ncbi:1-deoxy-D-xylulose-5-phosphate reductoisomerase [Planctomycetaceae bacterium SH139]